MSWGESGKAFNVNGTCYSPSICFETTLARVIRRQILEARSAADGCDPQVLVNVTNDGWFWGSAELDMHLVCGVFRAVECRKPLVIAANTGFSGWIDSDGRIIQQGKRRDEDILIAEPRLDQRASFYLRFGDVFAWPCFAICLAAAINRHLQIGVRIGKFAKREPKVCPVEREQNACSNGMQKLKWETSDDISDGPKPLCCVRTKASNLRNLR